MDYNSRNEILDSENKNQIFGEIYVMTNNKNGKQYVGQTQSHRKNHNKYRPHGSIGRFKAHLCEAMRNTRKSGGSVYLNQAIRKYGQDSFDVKVVTFCHIEDLDFLESHFIKQYNTYYPNGYNLTRGGKSATWANEQSVRRSEMGTNTVTKRGRGFGFKHTEETIEKMKQNHQIVKEPEIVRNKMKKTMNNYYDEYKVRRLAEMELDDDVEKYVRPVYKKTTGELHNYIIRINRNTKFTMETAGQTPEVAKERLLNVLYRAKELRNQNLK